MVLANLQKRIKKGFTLVEMLVVIGIMAVVMTVVLWNNRSFDSSILLSNLAHDVALSLRQAQIYGISVRGDAASDDFNAGYGIHFDLTKQTQYVFFADEPNAGTGIGNNIYVQGQDTILNTYMLQNGYTISRIYSINASGNETALDVSRPVNIVFVRPDPDAVFSYNGIVQNYRAVRIELASRSGSKRSVVVTRSGQISVKYENE